MPNLVANTESVTTYDAVAHRFANPPPGKLYLLYGDPAVFPCSLMLASYALLRGNSIAVIDGCNRFDAHGIARFAREHNIEPHVLLNRIHISRGFTCYQMEAAVNDRLMPFLKRINANTALIFGLLDTFYDEQAPLREVQQILRRVMEKLREMKSAGISVLLALQAWNVLPKERNQLLMMLKAGMDNVYRVEASEDRRDRGSPERLGRAGPAGNQPKLLLEQSGRRIHHGTHRTDIHQYHR